jgi:hypothetical protein
MLGKQALVGVVPVGPKNKRKVGPAEIEGLRIGRGE